MSAAFRPVQSEAPIVFRFDARGIAKRFRHASIFASLDALRRDETLRVVSDHDPQQLVAEVARRYGGAVICRYVERSDERVVVDFQRC